MATKIMTEREFTMDGSHTYVIGDTGQRGGTWTIQFQAVSGTRSIVVAAKAKRSSLTPVAILYSPLYLNGSVAAAADPVSTAITTDSLIQVVAADGMDICLVNTHTTGSITVNAQPSS